jgi:hypothetical protein
MFGIEYGNTDSSWAELLRVLRPHARVALVLHKRGSHLDAVAADELVIGNVALAPDGVLTTASRLAPFAAQATSAAGRALLAARPEAESVRRQYNAASAGLVGLSQMVKHGDYAHDILAAVTRVLAGTGAGLAEAEQRLASLRRGTEDHLARIAALRACALDVAGMQVVYERLVAAGFALTAPTTISERGFEMGWVLEGKRE